MMPAVPGTTEHLGARRSLAAVAAVWVVALIASGIAPRDRLTWFMEVLPVLIALPLIVATRVRFPFTTLAYALIAAHEFLGTQGDEWDTQWDMFLALVGACTAQWLLARVHDRQLAPMRK